MIEVPKPKGNTPFDLIEHKRMMGAAQVNAASMMQELVITLQECDLAIEEWRESYAAGSVDELHTTMAAEVLKERRKISKTIDSLAEVMTKLFGLEA